METHTLDRNSKAYIICPLATVSSFSNQGSDLSPPPHCVSSANDCTITRSSLGKVSQQAPSSLTELVTLRYTQTHAGAQHDTRVTLDMKHIHVCIHGHRTNKCPTKQTRFPTELTEIPKEPTETLTVQTEPTGLPTNKLKFRQHQQDFQQNQHESQ